MEKTTSHDLRTGNYSIISRAMAKHGNGSKITYGAPSPPFGMFNMSIERRER